MKKILYATVFITYLIFPPSAGAYENYANGSDFYKIGSSEFYSNTDDEDTLYKIDLSDMSEKKVLDRHIISMIGRDNSIYLFSYDNDGCSLIVFDTETENCIVKKTFNTLITNISMRDNNFYCIADKKIICYNMSDDTVKTVINDTGIDLMYFSDFNTLHYYSKTPDGRYNENIYSFDLNTPSETHNISLMSASSYSPRLSEPTVNNPYYTSLNVFYNAGYGMIDSGGNKRGNCTCYAYGRAYENLGYKPLLSTHNAGMWYADNQSSGAYSYGSKPSLGAVAVWSKAGASGHVAVVEIIDGDTVITSESGWNSFYFKTVTRSIGNSNFSQASTYSFLGFIHILGTNAYTTAYSKSYVQKNASVYTIETELYNIPDNCTAIFAGYKNNKLVTFKSIACKEHTIKTNITGDLDEIKLMIWKEMKPFCDMEIIFKGNRIQ